VVDVRFLACQGGEFLHLTAERARKAGHPERFTEEALRHNPKAVGRAYSKKAEGHIDSLDKWEEKMEEKVVAEDDPSGNPT
jgi:hypothetical protein